MEVDFSRLGGSNAADAIVVSRDLFNVLPSKATRYQYPRDVQADVWGQWFARRTERDLTIKLNTGGGKTVVGLVAPKSWAPDKDWRLEVACAGRGPRVPRALSPIGRWSRKAGPAPLGLSVAIALLPACTSG
jgi:hypothetical protein